MLNSSAIYGPPLRAFLQSRAFVPVMARERDWGWSACAPADGSIPSHSSCKFLLNQLAEIHLGCVALITQLCPKRHTDVFIHIKVIQCPGPGPQHQYSIYLNTTGHLHAKWECFPLRFLGHIDSPVWVPVARAIRTTTLIQTGKSSRAGGILEPGLTSPTGSLGDSTMQSFTAWAFRSG